MNDPKGYKARAAEALELIRSGAPAGNACKAAGISVQKLVTIAPEEYSEAIAQRQARVRMPDQATRLEAIRQLHASGRWTLSKIAAAFGVSKQRVAQILEA